MCVTPGPPRKVWYVIEDYVRESIGLTLLLYICKHTLSQSDAHSRLIVWFTVFQDAQMNTLNSSGSAFGLFHRQHLISSRLASNLSILSNGLRNRNCIQVQSVPLVYLTAIFHYPSSQWTRQLLLRDWTSEY